jgi:GTP cyclohydrolase I
MEMRGDKKSGAIVTTSAVRGEFEERAVRDELWRLVPGGLR